MQIDFSEKLKKLPPYLFIEIDKKKKLARPDFELTLIAEAKPVFCRA